MSSREREREKDNVLKDKREEKAAERNWREERGRGGRWSESWDRQKRNNSFSLTVSTEIHKRAAKYNSRDSKLREACTFTTLKNGGEK